MTTLQIQLNDDLAAQLQSVAGKVGISRTAYVKTLIARDLGVAFNEDHYPGNIFNAERDNNGKVIPLGDFAKMVKDPHSYNWKQSA